MSRGKPNREPSLRRCLACRSRAAKREMLRFVAMDGELLFDIRQKAPGRGAQVCPARACLERAYQGAFRRGLPGVELPKDGFDAWLSEAVIARLEGQLREMLSLGRKSGHLVIGSEKVNRAFKAGNLGGLVLAADASAGTRDKYAGRARAMELPIFARYPRGRIFCPGGEREQCGIGLGTRGSLAQVLGALSSVREFGRRIGGELSSPEEEWLP